MEKKLEYKGVKKKRQEQAKKIAKNNTQKIKEASSTVGLKPQTVKNVSKIANQVDSSYYQDYNFQVRSSITPKPKENFKNNERIQESRSNAKVNKNNKLKNEQLNKPKKKKRKKVILTFIILFLFLAIFVTGGYFLCTLSKFNITNFNIEGIAHYSEEEIIQNLGMDYGKNVFVSVFKNVNNNARKLPYVDNLKLGIKLPGQVDVKITERTSYYFVFDKEKNRFFRLDRNGNILEQSDINQKTNEELLTFGINFDDEVVFGQKINEIDISKLYIYENIETEYYNSGISGKITKVNFENSLTTITLNDKLNVILPNDTNLKYNLAFLNSIIQKIGEDKVGVIDMTKSKPTFSSF